MNLGQVIDYENKKEKVPIKSKDKLLFRCGWRTWYARPIFYQQNLNSDKHKFERFLPTSGFYSASVIGPVTYLPTPVLVFHELSLSPSFSKILLAIGNLSTVDADRI